MFNGQKPSAMRLATFWVVLAVHVGVIFIPLGVMFFMPEKPKQIPFRVKLGGSEPSHAPEIGPPQRRRYTGTVGGGAPPLPPPQEAPAPKPIPAPQPKPGPPKPKPAPKPAPNPAPKPAPNPEQESVYNPDQSGPIGGGGSNLNPNVPGGSKDQAQAYGKPDNHSPGGGANVKVKQYAERSLMPYLKSRWKQPPDSLLKGKRPAVEISLTILPTGKVKKATVTRASNVAAMDDSVKRLLNGLDILPRPPDGELTIKITLETE